ncbi:MAG TPA: hypothetical protein DEA22_11515 [Blastocatellia bacterium]|nr:hypothetical protein [Blastocatellia bacterium]
MNEDDNRKVELPADDEHTTEPNPPAPAAPPKWEMPKPVFQQSSGYLPKGYAEQFAPSAGESSPVAPSAGPQPADENKTPDDAAAASANSVSANIEPQPEIYEPVQPEEDPPGPALVDKKPKRGFLRIAMVILGLLAIGLLMIAFLAGIWYFFISSDASRGSF